MTPPEVLAHRPIGSLPDSPGWAVRVVPNKYPALDLAGDLATEGKGLFTRMNGVGAHEVIIETPDHGKTLGSMSIDEITQVLTAIRERVLALKQDRRLRFVLVFKNHGGAAGASLEHPHSQLIALPVVPDLVREELDGAKRHFAATRRCVFCDVIGEELAAGTRVIHANAEVVALAPYAARFPFETWLLPRHHVARFEEASPAECESFARVLQSVVTRLERALDSPAYNFILHSAPFADAEASPYHWHAEILPKISRAAGFEWGAGFYINPVAPEEAARILREVAC